MHVLLGVVHGGTSRFLGVVHALGSGVLGSFHALGGGFLGGIHGLRGVLLGVVQSLLGGFGGRILLFLAGNQGQGEQRSRKDQFTHGSLFSRLGELNRTGLIDMPTLAGTPGKCGKWKDICRLPHCHMSSRQLMVAPRPMPFVPAMLWAEAGW